MDALAHAVRIRYRTPRLFTRARSTDQAAAEFLPPAGMGTKGF